MKEGVIEMRTAVLEQKMVSGDGFVCVENSGVTILADHCRFEGDEIHPDSFEAQSEASGREYDIAKAKIAATFIKLSGKKDD